MTDRELQWFLRWALPELGMRWTGFRKVRTQVGRRIRRRIDDLGLSGFEPYRAYLERHPDEWGVLDGLCRVTISRFYRDRGVFAFLERDVLPALCEAVLGRHDDALQVWSVGCASGEEPYTIALLWALRVRSRYPSLGLGVLGTDTDPTLIGRAREAVYASSSLKDVPADWLERAFVRAQGGWRLRDAFLTPVTFALHDVRTTCSAGPFDLLLCRNLVFTYFDTALQASVAERLRATLRRGGALVLGSHERLPRTVTGFSTWSEACRVYRKR